MKNKVILTITSIFTWIMTIIPATMLISECIDSYINGTYHGFNSEGLIFGIQAFLDTFCLYIFLYFPLVILWLIIFIATVVITTVTIINFCKHE